MPTNSEEPGDGEEEDEDADDAAAGDVDGPSMVDAVDKPVVAMEADESRLE